MWRIDSEDLLVQIDRLTKEERAQTIHTLKERVSDGFLTAATCPCSDSWGPIAIGYGGCSAEAADPAKASPLASAEPINHTR